MILLPTRQVEYRFNQGDKDEILSVPFGMTIAEILETHQYPREGHEVWVAEMDGKIVSLHRPVVCDCKITVYNRASLHMASSRS